MTISGCCLRMICGCCGSLGRELKKHITTVRQNNNMSGNTILITGISGLDRERAWSECNIKPIDLGDEMLEIAKSRHMDLDKDTILYSGRDTLSALRAAAILKIKQRHHSLENGKTKTPPLGHL